MQLHNPNGFAAQGSSGGPVSSTLVVNVAKPLLQSGSWFDGVDGIVGFLRGLE